MFWDEDPFEEMRRIMEEFDRIDRMFYPRPRRRRYREPVTDVWENDDYVYVTAELPGIKKDEIDLNVEEDSVEIRARAKSEKKEEEEGRRFYGAQYRTFYTKVILPSPVNPEKAEATFSNGILEIKIPKVKEKKHKIEIKEKK